MKAEGIVATRAELLAVQTTPVALVDCTLPQLEVLHAKFAELEALHERGSGVAATLRGLVLTEVKAKVAHGQFLPWVKKSFGKSPRTATDYMRLAGKFVKESKSADVCRFDFLTASAGQILALIDEHQLDLNNPTVAAVIRWSEDKDATQLLLDLGPTRKGGKTYERGAGKGGRKTLTAEEAAKVKRTMCVNGAQHAAAICKDKAYVVLTQDAELDGLIDHFRAALAEVEAWRKLSPADREAALAERLRAEIGDAKPAKPKKAKGGK